MPALKRPLFKTYSFFLRRFNDMSAQVFLPEILDLLLDELALANKDPQSRAALLACTLVNRQFYHQASSYIFSSLAISTQKRLDALLDILNANPDIARHIRSFTAKHEINQTSSECLSAVLRQLCRLQEFGWIGLFNYVSSQVMLKAITVSVSSLCSDHYLTALHFVNMSNFPLSLFSSCCHLESLSLIGVLFTKIRPETLSGSLFPSLRRLSISNPWSGDEEVGIILTHAAPTLTTLILRNLPWSNVAFFLNFKSTVVLPVLESIQMDCKLGDTLDTTFLSRFLEYSPPMLAQIQIQILSTVKYSFPEIQQPLAEGFLPIDKMLSSPRYRTLKTLDIVFPDRFSPRRLCSDSLEVLTLLNEILPAASSRTTWFYSAIVGATLTNPPPQFSIPQSTGLDFVNLLIGNGGDTPNGSGGMIPSTAPPFGMTRWVAQTQVSYVSATPFNWTLNKVMGAVGTHQPAIWMGESAPISVSAGVGEDVVVDFEKRGLDVLRGDDGQKIEVVSVGYYNVLLDDGYGGSIMIEQTATSRVAHLRFTFNSTLSPYILFEIAQVCGSTSERHDNIITPISIAPFAERFKGYFCARFDQDTPEASYGIIQNGTLSFPSSQNTTTEGPLLSAFAKFPTLTSKPSTRDQTIITLRVGTSFISEDQARSNIDVEIPTPISSVSPSNTEPTAPTVEQPHFISGTFENTAYRVDASGTDPLEIVDLQSFWTAVVHTLQYPYEQHEQNRYYSGYDNVVHQLEKVVNPTPDTRFG
ncbi:hypothetical protein BYT27DRAFT_7336529 [Phlegmacium glaucopus]|nr:hypothetical protein BYT27DRAFT_7336529 [Phlegmacium glaucopus]